MAKPAWTQQDLDQMASLGISPETVQQQIDLFKNPPAFIHLSRPARLKDGIVQLNDQQISAALRTYESAQKRFLKFVPASGAATRMFQSLFKFAGDRTGKRENIQKLANDGDKEALQVLHFMENLSSLAFYPVLKKCMAQNGLSLEKHLSQGDYGPVLFELLTSDGLDYAQLPKGLVQFHGYPEGARTPFEEHLDEAARIALGVHFTISEEHQERFEAHHSASKIRPGLKVDFSVQDPASQTIAVTEKNEPFRDETGKLVFRPAGHGALLRNLEKLQGDLVFIKNIDNVAAAPASEETVLWKKILGGHLVSLQKDIFELLAQLEKGNGATTLNAAAVFCRNELCLDLGKDYEALAAEKKVERLKAFLDRPLRICGVVANTGEPGGGPFWVKGKDGLESLQIVEGAQVNRQDPGQKSIFESSTHFNPVDLVCALRDRKGKPYLLNEYVDPDTVFISEKSVNGQKVKALELPGLWNGAMAHWTTVFMEVPSTTFNPVKTVFDLLRPAHQV